MTLIACQDAAFAYEGMVAAEGLNFSVDAGDYLCVVGENGAGKTTLAKGLLGLIPPKQGRILRGEGFGPTDIGYLPQQLEARKDFPAGVLEIALSGLLSRRGFRPFYNRDDREKAEANLRRLGVDDLKNHCFPELSSGQQRRVLLARALGAMSKMLLLDEPTAGLDPIAAREFYKLAQEVNHSGVAVIMVSHDLRNAAAYASHILHLRRKQIFFGSVEDYRRTDMGRNFPEGERHV
ncbi:MAG: metal ABC transporter ATP-binding protein [Desulfovibrionaceae bacterium]|nr:metal ABC transporter ATP-binding protein [Desulfovibrionaceae bacterium]